MVEGLDGRGHREFASVRPSRYMIDHGTRGWILVVTVYVPFVLVFSSQQLTSISSFTVDINENDPSGLL